MADPTGRALSAVSQQLTQATLGAVYSGPPLLFRTRVDRSLPFSGLVSRKPPQVHLEPPPPALCRPQAPQGAAHFPGQPLGDLRKYLPGQQPPPTINTLLGVGLGFAFKPKDCLFSF